MKRRIRFWIIVGIYYIVLIFIWSILNFSPYFLPFVVFMGPVWIYTYGTVYNISYDDEEILLESIFRTIKIKKENQVISNVEKVIRDSFKITINGQEYRLKYVEQNYNAVLELLQAQPDLQNKLKEIRRKAF